MVAVALIGIGVVTVIQLYSTTLRTIRKTTEYSTALIYARSYMEEAFSMSDLDPKHETFDLPQGFKAERAIDIHSKEAEYTVYDIKVAVTWPPSGKLGLSGKRIIYEKK